jgi:hypothetical protein
MIRWEILPDRPGLRSSSSAEEDALATVNHFGARRKVDIQRASYKIPRKACLSRRTCFEAILSENQQSEKLAFEVVLPTPPILHRLS